MGWFTRGRDDEELKQIALRIATNLQRVRAIHFRRCVQRLEQLPDEERTERVRVLNRSLGGHAELAMAAFQLRHLNADSPAAFSRSDLRRLLGLVQTRVVAGNHAGQLAQFDQFFAEVEGKPELVNRFNAELAKYITQSDGPLFEMITLAALMPMFLSLTRAAVEIGLNGDLSFDEFLTRSDVTEALS